MQVAQPTTPAQLFHLLRRQALRPWRKPLVIFTPKSLLRHPDVVSDLDDFANGGFQRILPDTGPAADAVTLLLCTGKVYFDLVAERARRERHDVAIIRIEQLYPLSAEVLASALASYAQTPETVWVQEEPVNMGAWRYIRERWPDHGAPSLSVVARPESSSPATGSHRLHVKEQTRLLEQAFS